MLQHSMKEMWQHFILSNIVLILYFITIAQLSKYFNQEHFCPFIHEEFENESTGILAKKEANIECFNFSQNTSEHVNCK